MISSALVLVAVLAACGQQAGQDQQTQGTVGKEETKTSQAIGAETEQPAAAQKDASAPDQGKTMARVEDAPPSPQFQALDTNGDGQISVKEAKSNSKLSNSYKKLDRDGDGQLTKSEFSAFATQKAGKPMGQVGPSDIGGGAQARGTEENPNRPN